MNKFISCSAVAQKPCVTSWEGCALCQVQKLARHPGMMYGYVFIQYYNVLMCFLSNIKEKGKLIAKMNFFLSQRVIDLNQFC